MTAITENVPVRDVPGREHRAFNDKLQDLGYPTDKIQRIV